MQKRTELSSWRDIAIFAVGGLAVASVVFGLGSVPLALALRAFIRPSAVAIFASKAPEAVPEAFSTQLSIMFAVLAIAPLAGLLTAGASRWLGTWRLLIPVISLGFWAAKAFATSSHQVQQPLLDGQVREAAGAFLAGFWLLGMVYLLAIVPALVGAWLGMKLWPTPSRQALEHEDQLPAE